MNLLQTRHKKSSFSLLGLFGIGPFLFLSGCGGCKDTGTPQDGVDETLDQDEGPLDPLADDPVVETLDGEDMAEDVATPEDSTDPEPEAEVEEDLVEDPSEDVAEEPAGPTWARSYGGTESDGARSIQPTLDGGYIVAGYATSFLPAGVDLWVVKLDASGYVQWEKTYGGSNADVGFSILQTSDGGYLTAGETMSFGAGSGDFLILKLNASGDVEWQKAFGDVDRDTAGTLAQSEDGGYVAAGSLEVSRIEDLWVLKLDSLGNVQWQKAYGGSGADLAYSIRQAADGGYWLGGFTESFGEGDRDSWILRLDASGNVVWQKTYGGPGRDLALSIWPTADGGCIWAGSTASFGLGSRRFWVVKLNASGNIEWQKAMGTNGVGSLRHVEQTGDNGYIVAGTFGSMEGSWLIKLSPTGDIQWEKIHGAYIRCELLSGHQNLDGSYVFAGWSGFGAGWENVWVIKLDDTGSFSPACSSVTSMDATSEVTDTTAVPADTIVVPREPTYSTVVPDIVPVDTHAVVETQCGP